MSTTPHRPNPYQLRSNNSVIRRPIRECRKRVASPIRYNPMERSAPKEITSAPKSKRIRQSRLQIENIQKMTESPISPINRYLPIRRLQFENPDFMDLYSDDSDPIRPDSIAFLSNYLTEALKSDDNSEKTPKRKKKKKKIIKKSPPN